MMKGIIVIGLILVFGSFSSQLSYRFDDIQFEIDSSDLHLDQLKRLESTITTINQMISEGPTQKRFKLWIDGHADASEKHPARLAEERSKIVMANLLGLGLTGGDLLAKGYGTKKPLTNSSSHMAKRKNARVHFRIAVE